MNYTEKYNNINKGTFVNGKYIKMVKFSEAILWKDRQLSLRGSEMNRIKKQDAKVMIFKDMGKREQLRFKTEQVLDKMILKTVGQEPQYYFPIDLAIKEDIKI